MLIKILPDRVIVAMGPSLAEATTFARKDGEWVNGREPSKAQKRAIKTRLTAVNREFNVSA